MQGFDPKTRQAKEEASCADDESVKKATSVRRPRRVDQFPGDWLEKSKSFWTQGEIFMTDDEPHGHNFVTEHVERSLGEPVIRYSCTNRGCKKQKIPGFVRFQTKVCRGEKPKQSDVLLDITIDRELTKLQPATHGRAN